MLLPDAQTWVALDDGRIVAVLTLDGDDLDQLYVAPDAAGQGIGSALVDLAKDLRPGGLALWTFQTNTRAQDFYRRHDFLRYAVPTARRTRNAPRTSAWSGATTRNRTPPRIQPDFFAHPSGTWRRNVRAVD